MTLILGIAGTDGVLMCSDGAATQTDHAGRSIAKQETEKLFQLGDNIIWGAAGTVGTVQRVADALSGAGPSQVGYGRSAQQVREFLVPKVNQVLKRAYAEYVPVPGHPPFPPIAEFLFGCVLRDGNTLIAIDADCKSEILQARFHALGSGAKAAFVLMTRYGGRAFSLREAEVVAYRAVDDAIRVEPYGLGHPVHLMETRIVSEKPEHYVPTEMELKGIGDTVNTWAQLEAEALRRVFEASPSEEPIPKAPATPADAGPGN